MKFTIIFSLFLAMAEAQPRFLPYLNASTALKASKAALPVGGTEENTAPFDMPAGYTYRKITDRKTLNASGTFPPGFGAWDMVTYAAPENTVPGLYPNAGNFIFIPFETGAGGILRYNTVDGSILIFAQGNSSLPRNLNPSAPFDVTKDNFVSCDPATFTPFNTLIWGEETTGGRLFEVQFPFAATQAAAGVRWLTKVPATSHEGLRFDKDQTLYFIDESNTGSIYKYVPSVKGNLANGQTFVLRVSGYVGDVTQNWDSFLLSPRVGSAVWVPITNVNGTKTTTADPFQYNATIGSGARAAADEVLGTPYGRPEDIVISTDRNGREVLYFTATSENTVYAVTLLSATNADVKVFCDRNTINIATGLPVGANFTSPDNLAIDFEGTIYVIEDQGPPVADIWQAVDANNDGVAEYLGLWLSLGATGAEPTGLMFHPNDVNTAVVAIQHPSSSNDALFEIKFGSASPPGPQKIPILTSATALKTSKAALAVGGTEENTTPFDMPAGYTYRKITDRKTLNASGTFPPGFSNWDMVTYAAPENSKPGQYPDAEKFIFIPMESAEGGLLRYNTVDGSILILARGNATLGRNFNPATFDVTKDNYEAVDPSTFTPFNTVLFAEERQSGRIFEVQFPFAATQAEAKVRWLSKIPATSHEGLRFDKDQTLYFIDESNTGSIYKYVPTIKGNLTNGQSFVLRVSAYEGNVTADWNANLTSPRVGAAVWVPMTDINGNKITAADPFQYNASFNQGARAVADELFGTPYGRPEDMVISTDKNGREVLYFTATSENAVYTVTLLSKTTADVKVFCDRSTVNIATGLPVGSALSSPDNLGIDADGKIYVVEDQAPNTADIWQAVDLDNDGVAEYLALWLSLGATGAEPTGLFFSPNVQTRAIVAIQHPSSTNDALFEINFNQVSPPTSAPVTPPAPTPVTPPAPAPVTPPVTPPVKAPTKAPVKAPTKAPVKVPTNSTNSTAAPVEAPIEPPITEPCGLLGLSIFCPFQCGFFKRLLGIGGC